jgi:hypothetical protein
MSRNNDSDVLTFILGASAALVVVSIAFVIARIFKGWEGLIKP